ncbi:uncharacterized protein I206_107453 [Kwoniella pini CBS 10737]|uniref:Actin-like ATPase domain-containing protein n=1 Tax=Kwoniella pini CBS 10737 TaxID=1296096 RepID=A0A1B9HXD9_9TREE|nr:uncharacterized protein I206_05782 [Kwoniella pini CBS 10737]OCF47918.1 hypothetical protein I206_05782 [Kwoniella pini CBS 10737]
MSSSSSAGLRPGPSTGSITTPTKRAAFAASTEAGPSRARPAGASPAYSSRRHSLYGIEDRVVIDPGSRIWKVGFSGEADPRSVFYALDSTDADNTGASEAWGLDPSQMSGVFESRSEGERLIGVRVIKKLRETFVKHLMTDSKARKVIIIENTFIPIGVKEHIARALFDNLQVPSVSFTPSSLLSLAACGRITGLVIDVGWLETTVTPVYHSRPLYNLARSTPLAGKKLHGHLRTLIRHHAIYIPPPLSLSKIHDRRAARIPSTVLTDDLVERILTEGCFVGNVHLSDNDDPMDVDLAQDEEDEETRLAKEWKDIYSGSSTAKDMRFRIPSTDFGPATIIVPGWIRERVAELLLVDDENSEEGSIPNLILDCILKLPIDIRSTVISSLLVVGGTASLPGFIPRLRISLLQLLLPSPVSTTEQSKSPMNSIQNRKEETILWRKRNKEPYKEIYGLASKLIIVNDPAPLDGEGGNKSGKAPRWSTSLISWVGGSLAGSLKTSSPELTREVYDTNISLSINRGENYKEEIEISEIDLSTSIGVNIQDLKVGQAIKYQIDENDDFKIARKRGWKDNAGLSDWSRSGIRI